MARQKLSAAQIERLQPTDKPLFVYDTEVPGFGVRVAPGGLKAYIVQARLHGRVVRLTIGDTRAWGLKDARVRAAELKTLMDKGIDPREHEVEAKAQHEARRLEEKRQQVTVAQGWAAYVEERRTKWSSLHFRDHLELSQAGGIPKKRGAGLTQAGPLHALMSLRMVDVTAKQLQTWLSEESAKRPARARLAFNLLRGFASWAEGEPDYRGLMDPTGFTTKKTREAVPAKRTKLHDRLQREHLRPWFTAVLALPSPVVRTYLTTLLLSGARPEEWAGVRWSDLQLDLAPSARIKDKVEGERTIPLGPYTVHLLLELKAANEALPNKRQVRTLAERGEEWMPSEWVFASKKSASGKLENANSAMHRACEAAGLPPVTLHGLRRSYAGLSEWYELPAGVAAQIQGHKPQSVRERNYVDRPLDLLRVWHSKFERWVLNEAGILFDLPEPAPQEVRIVSNARR